MAPRGNYTAIPSSIWAIDSDFRELSPRAQLLYLRLCTSEDRDAAGFVPLQLTLWSKASTPAIPPETIKATCDELGVHAWVLIDYDAERLWLCRFMAQDTFNSPNLYINAMNKIRNCSSWMLRDAAWKEVQRLGLPPVKSDTEGGAKVQKALDSTFGALQDKMAERVPETLPERVPERVRELSNVNANANEKTDADVAAEKKPTLSEKCSRCDKHPAVRGYNLCAVCRELEKIETTP